MRNFVGSRGAALDAAGVRALLLGTSAMLAGLAFGPLPASAQQAGGAQQTGAQQSQTQLTQLTQLTQRLQQAEQSLRQALERMGNAGGQGAAQAAQGVRQALTQLQGAMAEIPADRRGAGGYQRLEREVGEAQAALGGERPDMARARTQVEEVIVAIPILRAEVVAVGPAPAASGAAQVVVREASPTVQVQQAQPVVTVQQPQPVITVVVPQPEIIVRQPPPQVTVQMPQPQVAVRQPEPQVRVVEADPQVRVQPAQPQVQVQQAEPRVLVQQAQGEPRIRYEQTGQPVVTMGQRGDAESGASAAAATPAQSAGAQPQQVAAASPGMPLARVTSLVGSNVVGTNGRDAGEVENLLIDRQGNVRAAVVEWGGFLGIGENRAVMPIDQLRFGAAGERVRMELTREQLEGLPRYERNNLNEYATRYGWGDGIRLYR